jgi:peptidoglycan-associated lipoprotein
MKKASFAILAVLASLYGCATTESQDSSSSTGTAPSMSGNRTPDASPGSARSGQVGKGTDSGMRAGTGSQGADLKRSVYFEYDKYDIKPEYRPLLETHARWLKANPAAKLTVEGNADERGSREYNVALGQRRAESVTKMLVLLGARPDQIEAVSWGEEKPRGTGHDEASWSENRRSDFAQK